MTRRPLVRGRSALGLYRSGLNFKRDPDLARLGPGIFVLPKVFLGEGIDMRRCAFLGHVPNAATDLDVTIGIVGVEYRESYGRAFPHVARLHAILCGIYPDLPILVIEPNVRNL